MKQKASLILVLLVLAVLFPFAVSHASGTDVTVNGQTRHLDWDKINIKDGVMQVLVIGFENKDKGADFGMLAVVAGGREIRAKKAQDDGKGNCTYYFDCSAMPDVILFYPNDDTDRRILIWKSTSYGIRSAYLGDWTGTAVTRQGGEPFTVTASLEFDGIGVFKYKRGDSAGMFPFTAKISGTSFEAEVANGIMPITQLKGTLKYASSVLNADITAVFSDGTEETFLISFTRQKEEPEAEEAE